jgi:glycosyltransferase involved in cell wall biosynthesis
VLVEHVSTLTGRVRLVPMPVDSVFTEPTSTLRARNGQPPTVLAVGRLARQKGFHDLIAALALLRERQIVAQLVLAGDGEEEAALKELADSFNLHDQVRFLGSLTAAELAERYRLSDVVVLPSRAEGLGLTLIEAMFCGAPVVGTRSGGISDVINDGVTGLLVPAGDAQSLAEAIARIICEPDLAQCLGSAGQAFVRHAYDPGACVVKMLNVYQTVLAGRALIKSSPRIHPPLTRLS